MGYLTGGIERDIVARSAENWRDPWMDGVGWHFRRMSRGEINSNPMERELFSSESISERLVREVIQNSLDAGLRRRQGNKRAGFRSCAFFVARCSAAAG